MNWWEYVPDLVRAVGAISSRDEAKAPDRPESLTYDQIRNLILQDSYSPWGNRTYEELPGGRFAEHFQFTPVQQAIYDRAAGAALEPYSAYPIPPQLRELHESLMNSALNDRGPSARPAARKINTPRTASYVPPGGGDEDDPFSDNRAIGSGVTGGGGSATERTGIPSDRPGPGTGEAGVIDYNVNMPRSHPLVADSDEISDDLLEFVEKWGSNRGVQAGAGLLQPGMGSLLAALGYGAGQLLDTRFGERLSDYNNREWGNYDSTSPTNDFGYYDDLLGYDPTDFSNPQTGARLGEAGGMPGARHSGADIMEMYGGQVNVPRNMNLGYARNRFRTSNTMPNDAFNQSTRGGTYYIWSPLSLT